MLCKKFKIFCLSCDYNTLYKIINSLQHHIYNLFEKYIIDTTEKNLILNELYILVSRINTIYNECITEYNNIITDIENESLSRYSNNFKILRDLVINNYIVNNIEHELSYETIYPIKIKIMSEFFHIMTSIGYPDLKGFLSFIDNPLTIELKYEGFIAYKILQSNKTIKEFEICVTKNELQKIFTSCYDITIKHKNYSFIISGTFGNDYLNLDTRIMPQIMFPELYSKKLKLMEIHKDSDFKTKYLKYCDKGELIVLSYKEFDEKLISHEKFFDKIKNKSFSHLMQYFITKTDNPRNIYNIIRLLLLGNEDHINIAGMLFLVLREKKCDNIMISNLIYSSLNFVSQVKLKMVNINIEEETKQLAEMTFDELDLRKQMTVVKHMPNYVKNLVNEKINEMKLNNNDYHKQYIYAKTLIDFPWPSKVEKIFNIDSNDSKECKNYFNNIDIKLNEVAYGHIKAKEKISLHLGELISNPNASGYVMSLYGEPGVGKTLIAQSLADVLEMPLITLSMGGHNDSEVLNGVAYTYSSSQPGSIIKEIVRVGTTRAILYIDELDKTGVRNEKSHNEINAVISQLVDPGMNSLFVDKFFQGIKFPLNNIIVIVAYNTKTNFAKSLINRFDEIEIKPYNIREKIHIVKHFILKNLCKDINFSIPVIMTDDDIKKIIVKYTREGGVRDLKRKIKTIIMKLNKLKLVDRIDNLIVNGEIILKQEDINYFLKDECIYETNNTINNENAIGVIKGLCVYNDSAGDVISIQIDKNYNFNESFVLNCTGSQSEEMKESVQCAYTSAIQYIAIQLKFNNYDKLKNYVINNFPSGFHIHVNDVCTPKYGSSGGCAFALAFISLILGKPIKHNIAITGELDIKDNVIAVGGIDIKVVSAKNNGVNLVLIPYANKQDLDALIIDMPDLFDENFSYHMIANLSEAVNISF